MTTLGLPWWAWLVLAIGTELASFVWRQVLGPELRLRHRLTCRVWWQGRAILEVADVFTTVVGAFVLWGPYVGWFITGLGSIAEGSCVVLLLLRRHGCRPRAWTCDRGHRHSKCLTAVDTCHEAWRHRDHDDDCEHGPTKRWAGAGARLRSWAKVSLNPAFAPS